MKRKRKVLLTVMLVVILVMGFTACGKKADNGLLTDEAGTRSQEEGAGKVYIDDDAIALAGSFAEEDPALQQAAQDAFNQVNDLRAAQGLSTLTWSDDLSEAAYVRAQEIVGTFSHTRPDGSDWWTVNSSIMYGENLAKNYSSASSVVSAWMASPTHAANIMDGDYASVGIAVYQGSDGNWYWAQEFGY